MILFDNDLNNISAPKRGDRPKNREQNYEHEVSHGRYGKLFNR